MTDMTANQFTAALNRHGFARGYDGNFYNRAALEAHVGHVSLPRDWFAMPPVKRNGRIRRRETLWALIEERARVRRRAQDELYRWMRFWNADERRAYWAKRAQERDAA